MKLSRTEIFILSFVAILTLTGVIGSYISKEWYDNFYSIEDGFIEWFTVIPLVIVSIVCLLRLINLAKYKSWLFSLALITLAIVCIFFAGEEISWGQRIFGIESSDYFKENNAQGETNIHNLVVGGNKLNKIIFTTALGLIAGTYLLILPLVYNVNNKIKRFIDWAGVPVAQLYQIIAIAIVAALHLLIQSDKGKQPEVFEFGVCFIFLLIVAFPKNIYIYKK